MENHYKVELWIDEISQAISSSNVLKFAYDKHKSLRVVNDNYNEIFSCLVNDKSVRIANLEFNDNNFYQVLEEYQNSSVATRNIAIVTSTKKDEQNALLSEFKKENDEYIKKNTVCKFFITFGLLDYYNMDEKHTISSAPLVFLPIDIYHNEEDDFYQIKVINHEIYLNNALISYVRKSKKIDLGYPLNSDFSLNEYLLYVASKVHMFHWSVNNGVFISDFDIYQQNYLNDIIAHQEQIANNNLVKAITYYNSEFYNFIKNNGKLNKKLLSLLPLDNEEYHILKKVVNCESLLIKTDNLINKTHLINNLITNYLLNNKKVLVVYDNNEHKKEIFASLDKSLLKYTFDLNELYSNKQDLLNHLNHYEGYKFDVSSFDPIVTQEVISSYYDSKNKFKSLINELRVKREPFAFSLNECIENYYRLSCPLIDVKIRDVALLNVEQIENIVNQIREFEDKLRKLNLKYVDHPFYGFNKNTMMMEEYMPLKNAATNLAKDIKRLQAGLLRLYDKFSFPLCLNLKQTKAILNILSCIDTYRNYPSSWFDINSWDNELQKFQLVEKLYKSYEDYRKEFISRFGENTFNIDKKILENSLLVKKMSKKELNKFKPYFKDNTEINLALIQELNGCVDVLNNLFKEYQEAKNQVDSSFETYFNDGHYNLDVINEVREKTKIFNHAIKYLFNEKIVYSSKDLIPFKDDKVYSLLSILRLRLQILFNRIYDNCAILQPYFDHNIFDFTTLDFNYFYNKTKAISTNFISINNYLDFYIERYKLNKLIPTFADALLKEDNLDLYELMFYKRLYFDYANYIMDFSNSHSFTSKEVFSSIDAYNISEENRINIVDSILKSNYNASLRNVVSNLKRYEYDFVENEKKHEKNRTLSRITYLAHESIYHTIPCLFTPLKSVSTLLNSEDYIYDVVILLLDRTRKTKEVLSAINKTNQIILFDNEYVKKEFVENYIDYGDSEFLFSAMKRSFESVEFVSKTYATYNLKANKANPYFKRYLKTSLEEAGFKVASDVNFTNGVVDFLVKSEKKSFCTALIIDNLPYYSLESAQESFIKEDELLMGYYPYIRVFPFSFFKNEEKEKKYIIETIISNSLKEVNPNIKIVKKKLTDAIFLPYRHPYYVYHENKAKYTFDRKGLMLRIIDECAPILEQDILNLFSQDGSAYISSLIKEKKIYRKNKFIYIPNKDIIFRSYKNNAQPRYISSVSQEEIEDGVLRIIETTSSLELGAVIKMILIALGYNKMNSKIHEYIYRIIIDMVHNHKVTLSENFLSLVKDDEKNLTVNKEALIKREG